MLVIIAALLAFSFLGGEQLVLKDEDSCRIFARFPVHEGDEFSITFVHSVNQTPVQDFFEVRDGKLCVTKTLFYQFGAGMQTDWGDHLTMTYLEDGGILLSGYDIELDNWVVVVGMASDHTLSIGGETYSLTELCGRGSAVLFDIYE